MPNTIQLPKTIKEATKTLGSLEGLITAKQWERAAIVYAFTTAKDGRPQKETAGNPAVSLTEFAALGIVGLASRDTVSYYRAQWQAAIDAGKARVIAPGALVKVPDMEWPAKRDVRESMVVTGTPEQIADRLIDKLDSADLGAVASQLITADPLVARAIATNLPARAWREIQPHTLKALQLLGLGGK